MLGQWGKPVGITHVEGDPTRQGEHLWVIDVAREPQERAAGEGDTTAPLRARVAHLGRLVGEVLHWHARPRTFEYVERLRALTRRRRADPASVDDAKSMRSSMSWASTTRST